MKYYELIIKKTARPMGNNQDWQLYDVERKEFSTLEKIRAYLADQYYHVKTIRKMYQDGKNGETKEVGKIYCFKADPIAHDDVKHYEQHWVSVCRLVSKPVLL